LSIARHNANIRATYKGLISYNDSALQYGYTLTENHIDIYLHPTDVYNDYVQVCLLSRNGNNCNIVKETNALSAEPSGWVSISGTPALNYSSLGDLASALGEQLLYKKQYISLDANETKQVSLSSASMIIINSNNNHNFVWVGVLRWNDLQEIKSSGTIPAISGANGVLSLKNETSSTMYINIMTIG
jgi:hypothetical protein